MVLNMHFVATVAYAVTKWLLSAQDRCIRVPSRKQVVDGAVAQHFMKWCSSPRA